MITWDIHMVSRNNTAMPDLLVINRDVKCNEPLHTHKFIEIEYVIQGEGVQIINGVEYKVKRGDVFFLNIGDVHECKSNGSMDIINCIFTPNLFPETKENALCRCEMLLPNFIRLPSKYILEMEQLLLKIEQEHNDRQLGFETILKSYISILITFLVRCSSEANAGKDNEQFVDILKYVEQNFVDITLYDIARHFSYNSSYFSRYFKKNTGVSFTKYINDKRMSMAVDMLTNTNETVESIYKTVGFTNQSSFFRKFKESTGKTPSEFRCKKN